MWKPLFEKTDQIVCACCLTLTASDCIMVHIAATSKMWIMEPIMVIILQCIDDKVK